MPRLIESVRAYELPARPQRRTAPHNLNRLKRAKSTREVLETRTNIVRSIQKTRTYADNKYDSRTRDMR